MRDGDYNSSLDFLRKFFAGTEGKVELRVFSNNNKSGPRDFTRDTDRVKVFCQRNDNKGWAVCFGCATRLDKGSGQGKREDLHEVCAAWIDIDCKKHGLDVEEVAQVLDSCPCPPSICVFSGHGVHAYWLLAEVIDARWAAGTDDPVKAGFDAFLRRLAAPFCGDPSCCVITQIMRLPGTNNSKDPDDIKRAMVLFENDYRYSLAELEEMLVEIGDQPLIVPPKPAEADAPPLPAIPPAAADPKDGFLTYGIPPLFDLSRLDRMSYQDALNPIHAVRVPAIASMVKLGRDAETIFERVWEATIRAAGLAGQKWNWGLEEKVVRDEIASAYRKYPPKVHEPDRKVVQLRPGQGPKPDAAPDAAPSPASGGAEVRNDIGNAMQLLALHGSKLCYVMEAGWHIWDGKRYRRDSEMISAGRLAHDVSAQQLNLAFGIADKDLRKAAIKWAITTGTKARLAAMLHEARSYVAHEADEMDASIWLLNCQNGTLDLRDMTLRPHRPADLMTKICGTVYDPEAACPRWESFLAEIFNGDQEMVRFVQCALGYSLTGAMKENVFFILHGTGKNGKSKLLEAAARVLGDYMMSTPADTWAEKPPGAPSNDVAALPGARFVTTVETEKNHSLRAGLIKQITGGDKVSARKMYHDFFEFTPQCKLWIATNNKPRVGGSDGAIWDRIRLLPFNVKFVPEEVLAEGQKVRDNDLMEKLTLELPGILAWMVRGCAEWQLSGLPPAVAITEAAEVYRASEDGVQRFIDECCDASHGMTCKVNELFAAYEIWCAVRDEEAISKRALGVNFEERGYPASKSGAFRLRKGIDLKGKWRTAVEKGEPPDDVVAAEKVGT